MTNAWIREELQSEFEREGEKRNLWKSVPPIYRRTVAEWVACRRWAIRRSRRDSRGNRRSMCRASYPEICSSAGTSPFSSFQTRFLKFLEQIKHPTHLFIDVLKPQPLRVTSIPRFEIAVNITSKRFGGRWGRCVSQESADCCQGIPRGSPLHKNVNIANLTSLRCVYMNVNIFEYVFAVLRYWQAACDFIPWIKTIACYN